jgi:hypothetical protein
MGIEPASTVRRRPAAPGPVLALAALLTGSACAVRAQDSLPAAPSGDLREQAVAAALPQPSLSAVSESVPWIDGTGGASGVRRIDVVRWMRIRDMNVGMSLGLSQPTGAALDQRPAPTLSLGLRWRTPLDEGLRLDIAGWRWLNPTPRPADQLAAGAGDDASPPAYTTRIELQFVQPKGLSTELGAIGMQLDGDAKVTLRVRHGGPMLYYRRSF